MGLLELVLPRRHSASWRRALQRLCAPWCVRSQAARLAAWWPDTRRMSLRAPESCRTRRISGTSVLLRSPPCTQSAQSAQWLHHVVAEQGCGAWPHASCSSLHLWQHFHGAQVTKLLTAALSPASVHDCAGHCGCLYPVLQPCPPSCPAPFWAAAHGMPCSLHH